MSGTGDLNGRQGGEEPPFDLCVVLLNYNGGSLAQRAAEAALASEGVRAALVVVDNASTDGSDAALEALARNEPSRALFLRAGGNLGFAAGNNLGLWSMPARAICLLNNDAVVDPGTLGALLNHLDSSPRVGACGPRLAWPDGRPQAYSHGHDPSPAYLLRRAVARRRGRELHDWVGGAARPVDWVAGTCLVARTTALESVGLLDAGIFMYFEDNDLCRRLRQRGWTVDFLPSAVARHYNQPSYADRARRRRYYLGLARFYDRHYGPLAGAALRVAARLRLEIGG
jgi:hypothetical protein